MMARRYLDVRAMDDADAVVRCPVVQWDAEELCPRHPLMVGAADRYVPHRSLVVRPDTGELMLVFHLRDKPDAHATISAHDPHEARHERDWPRLARRIARHTNQRST